MTDQQLETRLIEIEAYAKSGFRIARGVLVQAVRDNPGTAKATAEAVRQITELAMIEDGKLLPPTPRTVALVDKQREIYEDLVDEIKGLGLFS